MAERGIHEAPLTIVPLTYGVMPRTEFAGKLTKPYRLSGDSSLVAMATIESHREIALFNVPVFIPGATLFNGEAVDAELMRDYMSHPKRHKNNRIPPKSIEATGSCTNTPTQIAEIKRRQLQGTLGWVLVICASWQKEDAQALMQAYHINGAIQTDEEILRKKNMGIFDHQRRNGKTHSGIVDAYKKKVETAKKLVFLDKFDKKGLFRTHILTKLIGIGISDWQFRDPERKAHGHIEERKAWVTAKRREQQEKKQAS